MLTAQDTMPQRDSAGVLLKLKRGFTDDSVSQSSRTLGLLTL